jgi:hypothetical protein
MAGTRVDIGQIMPPQKESSDVGLVKWRVSTSASEGLHEARHLVEVLGSVGWAGGDGACMLVGVGINFFTTSEDCTERRFVGPRSCRRRLTVVDRGQL